MVDFSNSNLHKNVSLLPTFLQIKILDQLNFDELFNFAKNEMGLEEAASDVFSRKFNLRNVAINECTTDWLPKLKSQGVYGFYEQFEGLYHLYGNTFCQQFLRLFGPCIEHLIINFGEGIDDEFMGVYQTIQKYCCNIQEISFNWAKVSISEKFGVFLSVKKVNFKATDDSCIKISWIIKRFPNVESLNFRCVKNDLHHEVNLSI